MFEDKNSKISADVPTTFSQNMFAIMHTCQRKTLVEPMINSYFIFLNLYVHYFKESSNMSFLMKWINTKQEA
jgi:hypothetical protein